MARNRNASAAGYESEKATIPGRSQRTVNEGVDSPQGLVIGTERSSVEEATPAAADQSRLSR